MTYKIGVDNFDKREWEQHALNFADYNIYQTWAYQEIRAKRDQQEVSRIIVKDEKDNIQIMCQIRIKNIKCFGLRIGYAQWGPLIRSEKDELKCTIQALKALREAYIGKKIDVLRFTPNICNNEMGNQISKMLISSGFQRDNMYAPYRSLFVRVDDSEKEIFNRMHGDWRRNIRKAQKADLTINDTSNYKYFDVLKNLYSEAKKRKGFSGVDAQVFAETQYNLSDGEKMTIISVLHKEKPITVLLVSFLGDTAVIICSANTKEGLKFGSSYLARYRAAILALHGGIKWLDLGGIDPRKNPKVYKYKKRMGGEELYHIGAFDAFSSFRAKVIWNTIGKLYFALKR